MKKTLALGLLCILVLVEGTMAQIGTASHNLLKGFGYKYGQSYGNPGNNYYEYPRGGYAYGVNGHSVGKVNGASTHPEFITVTGKYTVAEPTGRHRHITRVKDIDGHWTKIIRAAPVLYGKGYGIKPSYL